MHDVVLLEPLEAGFVGLALLTTLEQRNAE
jgi:hypothetical protein